MSQKNKTMSVKILGCILALVAVTLVGCRIVGNFPGDANATGDAGAENLALGGAILVPSDALTSIQANRTSSNGSPRAAELSGHLAVAGADVWLEELPDFPHEKTDKDGKYEFRRLPAGTYHVVASFKKADGAIMKTRSDAVEIASKKEKTTVPDLPLAPAGKVVSGVLRGADGEFLPPGTVLTLWGEKFTVGPNGTFTSPPLPNNVDTADILVAKAGVAKASQPKITVQFFSADQPTTVEVQVGGKNSSYPPIGASINVKKNGLPVTADNRIGKGDLVDLSLNLTNIDRTFTGITFEWDAGRGAFSTTPGNTDSAVWVAPASSGMATISVKISAPARGFCKVFLPIVVDVRVNAPRFAVAFDAQGGSTMATQTVESGAKVTEPAAPTRAGYTFSGWYKDPGFANQWNFATDTVTAATTLYAKWTGTQAGPYTLTYNAGANGSISGTSPQTLASGTNGTPVTAVAAVGFKFVNWSDARTDNPRTDTNVTGNVTVTANFVAMDAKIPGATIIFADGASVSKILGSGVYTNTVSGVGDGTITYTSGTEAVATVNASTGAVTLVGAGTTVITANKAATATHAAASANYTLTVTDKTPSTIIFANGASVSKILGSGVYTNTVSGVGDGTITYTSGTEAVATVNASTGAVTLVAAGTTVITANKAATATHAAASANYTLTVKQIITQFAITGVTAPVRGASPVTTITETNQYTGTIAWSGSPVTFAHNTVYTATITLSAKPGYTLTGVTADCFTVADATSATNPVDSGTVTALFPATLIGVGDSYGGGTVFCVSPTADTSVAVTTGSGRYGLIMANTDQVNYDSNANHGVYWSSAVTSVPGAVSLDNGAANTSAIIAAFPGDTSSNNAAKAARSYAGGGYTDWYLPSKNELNKMFVYANAHNLIGAGCSGSVVGGVQGLVGGYDPPSNRMYWSSSQDSSFSGQAWYQNFADGSTNQSAKTAFHFGVRAVRAFGN